MQEVHAYELLVHADGAIRMNLLRDFQSLKVSIDKKSNLMGMPLKVSMDQPSKSFFEIPLNMWKTNKANMRVTMRFGRDRTIVLDDSTLPEIEQLISQLPIAV
ncbi:MAG: hypothetical protein PXY39_11150 [archaeon]|nr:hypothetical protein [archaeon]